ncbi:MAG: aminopeptidase N [Campylobacterota bacterium]|nr:aminopeptidase N [Campylobacterota bacterium]
MKEPKTVYLKDYTPCAYKITKCTLEFDIYDDYTIVTNRMEVVSEAKRGEPLRLDGEALKLESLKCNGNTLPQTQYRLSPSVLEIDRLSEQCTLELVTTIYPDDNSALEGLYRSGEILCTQNEPEGFRRITFFLDRPDNMARFRTKVIADKARYPILLSNGNKGESGDQGEGRHWVVWEDPFPKPTYLFALVAGELGSIHDAFTTMSGREIELNIYCDPGNESKCHHAMRSLKASMRWDEEVYGREYDLDIYNIVAVDSFNMGAMENKGLNIFNSHYVLADEETATDQNFLGIESVIAHEYFHNWTGNRITCRDWFQLTLKEGLTVFRDQSFSADMNSEVVQRISDVKALRERQFIEDAGPTAHPIKPDHYIEINNFYTATVYEKGAEVIRMIHTMLGAERFRKGTDLYFKTFDGQAVTTEDFIWAMSKGGGVDLTPFMNWYHQERTPELLVEGKYDEANSCYSVTLTQKISKNVHHQEQGHYTYPLGIALFAEDGSALPLKCDAADQPLLDRGILLINARQTDFTFSEITTAPKLSLNRHFTAPIKVDYESADHAFLMRHETDGFTRYEAAQEYALKVIESIIHGQAVDSHYIEAYGYLLADEKIDLMFKSQLLELPSVSALMQRQEIIDVVPIYEARDQLQRLLAQHHFEMMARLYDELYEPENISLDAASMGKRALKNRLLGMMILLDETSVIQRCKAQYENAKTMTDRITALDLLENHQPELAQMALQDFYTRYSGDTLVMNKYFSILAASEREGTIDRVQALENDPAYDRKVPNLVRSLIGVFARNHLHFHASSGYGYSFVADKIIELDAINPQIASGLSGAFKQYDRMNEQNKAVMKRELERILASSELSKNVYEIVEKILETK